MVAVSNIASSTASNWLKEAQESIAASENPGGLLGTLQGAKNPGSLKQFLSNSQNTAAALAQMNSSNATSQNQLTIQMANAAAQKRADEQAALQQKMNPQQTNYNPPTELDSFIYFEDGSNIDTVNNIMTMANGTQIDTTTGLQVVDPKSIISMANGAYLNTSTNILTMADGTKIDTVTGLKVTA